MKEYFDACLFDDRSIAFFQLSNNDTEQVQHRCLIPNNMSHCISPSGTSMVVEVKVPLSNAVHSQSGSKQESLNSRCKAFFLVLL